MESLHLLSIAFAYLPVRKLTGLGDFFYIYQIKSLNLVLIPGAKLDGHQGTWTWCRSLVIEAAPWLTPIG